MSLKLISYNPVITCYTRETYNCISFIYIDNINTFNHICWCKLLFHNFSCFLFHYRFQSRANASWRPRDSAAERKCDRSKIIGITFTSEVRNVILSHTEFISHVKTKVKRSLCVRVPMRIKTDDNIIHTQLICSSFIHRINTCKVAYFVWQKSRRKSS